MSDTTASVEAGKIDIGRVIGDTFKVIGRNFVTFAVLSLVLTGLPMAAFSVAQALVFDPTTGINAAGIIWWILAFLVFIATATILQATLIHTTVQDMSGKKATIGESLAVGLRALLPLIGLSLLFGLGVGLASLLLIVPGIMLLVAWFVAVPAYIMDRTTITGALGRSAQLTKGNRWRIFGLLAILYVVLIVVSLIIGAVTGGVAMSAAMSGIEPDPNMIRNLQTNPLVIGLNVLSQTITGMLMSAGIAVLYVELRRARDGVGAQSLADVFG